MQLTDYLNQPMLFKEDVCTQNLATETKCKSCIQRQHCEGKLVKDLFKHTVTMVCGVQSECYVFRCRILIYGSLLWQELEVDRLIGMVD